MKSRVSAVLFRFLAKHLVWRDRQKRSERKTEVGFSSLSLLFKDQLLSKL